MPSERSAKSARIVPTVVAAMMVDLYPGQKDIDTASPAVSPRLVAAIFISQNPIAVSGTLARVDSINVGFMG